MKRKMLLAIALLAMGFISQARPITIKKMGGLKSEYIEHDDNGVRSLIECGSKMNTLCFSITYDDGTVTAKPSDLKPGVHSGKASVSIANDRGELIAEGYLKEFTQQVLIDPAGNWSVQSIFKLNYNQDEGIN